MSTPFRTTRRVEFGDTDRKTLYIGARTAIYKIRVKVAGAN